MSFPFARTKIAHVQVDEGRTAEIELREMTLVDFEDVSIASAYGWLADFILGRQLSRDSALVLNAVAIGKLGMCLNACATIKEAPDGFRLEGLTPRMLSPLTHAFAELHFFDEASVRGLAIRTDLMAPLKKTLDSKPGSSGPASGSTSSSATDSHSPTSDASASAESPTSSTPRGPGTDCEGPNG